MGFLEPSQEWGHPTVECKQTMVSQNAYIADSLHALEVTNLNVVASNLLRTCFKSQSLPNSIIFITEGFILSCWTSSSYVPDPLQSARSMKLRQDLFEPDYRFQRRKVPDRLWTLKITYINVETNKLQRILPRACSSTDLNQFSIQQHLHIPAAVNT